MSTILNMAFLPIDTRIALREFDIAPKKVIVDTELSDKLNMMMRRRSHMYKMFQREHGGVYLETLHAYVSETKFVHVNIFVFKAENDIRFLFRVVRDNPSDVRDYAYNMHT